MRRLTAYGAAAVFLYLLGTYLLLRLAWLPVGRSGAVEGFPSLPRTWSVAGALHVHTERSHDAVGTYEQVARAARRAGLQFVLLSDHRSRADSLRASRDPARFLDGVLMVDGQELSLGGDVGRVLVFGLDTVVTSWEGGIESLRQRLAADGALAVVTHPRSRKARERWHLPDALGMAGWETFVLSDRARSLLSSPSLPFHVVSLSAGLSFGRADRSLLGMYRSFRGPGAAAYDSLFHWQPLTAMAGVNVHPKREMGRRLLPDYEPFFRTLVNHVVLEAPLPADPLQAEDSLSAAIARGRVFVSFGRTADAHGFRLVATRGSDVVGGMGDEVEAAPGTVLRARFEGSGAAPRVHYRIVRDGRTAAWIRGPQLDWPVPGAGAYRVEIHRYWASSARLVWGLRPWIFSNPVRVVGPGAPSRRPAG